MQLERREIGRRALFVVVHIERGKEGIELACEEARVAFAGGADGVFLIDHGGSNEGRFLMRCFAEVRSRIDPQYGIGLNFLDLDAYRAARYCPIDADWLWMDNAGSPRVTIDQLRRRTSATELFVPVAFKGQPQVRDEDLPAAVQAAKVGRVIVTSGVQTGSPPTPAKIATIRSLINEDLRLAVASGVDAGNVRELIAAGADYFLVASSLVDRNDRLIEGRVRALADIIHA